MTDKEIIIDGVNVARCINLFDRFSKNTDYCCTERTALLKCAKRNCYYKQLQRKSQECEELKEEFQISKDDHAYAVELEKDIDRYKQALEKIEEIVNEPCIGENDCKHCDFTNCEHKDILQIINEVKEP